MAKSQKFTLRQTDLVLAIINELSQQNPDQDVLPRQLNSIIDAANNIIREFSVNEITSTTGEGIRAWRKTDQVGRSSDFMAATLGHAGIRPYAYPLDPSDFSRCLTLLAAAPELQVNLPVMAATGPEWKALANNWTELVTLWDEESPSGRCPKLYNKMQSLLDSAHTSWGQA